MLRLFFLFSVTASLQANQLNSWHSRNLPGGPVCTRSVFVVTILMPGHWRQHFTGLGTNLGVVAVDLLSTNLTAEAATLG